MFTEDAIVLNALDPGSLCARLCFIVDHSVLQPQVENSKTE